jgi:NifU-like protein involved in Fe-S cluster formation
VWSATSISSSNGDEVRLEMAAASGVVDDFVLQWFGCARAR